MARPGGGRVRRRPGRVETASGGDGAISCFPDRDPDTGQLQRADAGRRGAVHLARQNPGAGAKNHEVRSGPEKSHEHFMQR